MSSLLLAVLVAWSPALAGDPLSFGADDDRDGPDSEPEGASDLRWDDDAPVSRIVNGEETRDFPQVAALSAQYSSIDQSFCSATLVAPDELVTAAHCIDGMRGHLNNGAVPYAVFGGHVRAGEVSFASEIVEWGRHPDWTGSIQSGGDIAWIRIAEPNTQVPPMPLFAGAAADLSPGEVLDFVGFGVTRDRGSDGGIKRTAPIPFRNINGAYLISRDPEKNVCSGDSGGAALRRVGEGQWVLVGVNSFVSDTAGDGTSCLTGQNGSTRVDLYRDWILQNTAATTDVVEPPDPADPVDPIEGDEAYGDWDPPQRPPEGSVTACASIGATSLGGLGLFALGLGLLRRRRS